MGFRELAVEAVKALRVQRLAAFEGYGWRSRCKCLVAETRWPHTRAAKWIVTARTIVVLRALNDLTAYTRSEIIGKDSRRRSGDGCKQRRRCGMVEERSGNEGKRAFGEWEGARHRCRRQVWRI